MLIRQSVLKDIAAGKVKCAFRRWERPTVKTGGTLKTSVGVLRIDAVATIPLSSITTKDARSAGYDTKEDLLADLAMRDRGSIYRIDLRFVGADPRIALREKSELSAVEIEFLRLKLARFDASSPHGPWTARVLESIRTRPKERARDFALRLDVSKEWLKTSVRKLKNLGLTISHEHGYELSPRGIRFLQVLQRQ
jgi:hypothetical protein